MDSGKRVLVLAGLLAALGVTLFAYKYNALGVPLVRNAQDEVWAIEAHVGLTGRANQPVKATLRLPMEPPGFGILNESFVSRDFGLITGEVEGGREAQWARRRAPGTHALYYRVVVYGDEAERGSSDVPPYPAVPDLPEPQATALGALVEEVRAHSADIVSFTAEMLRRLAAAGPTEQYIGVFLDDVYSSLDKAELAQTLLAGARIPTRIAHGVELRDQRNAAVVPWLEVHNGERWVYFDLTTGAQHRPGRFFVWWRGTEPLAAVEGGELIDATLSVRRSLVDSVDVAGRRALLHESRVLDFSLLSLPLSTQAVYAVLLLVPVGVFIMVLMRNIVGIPGFGTFTPVLIALAFRETQLLSGVLLFTLVVTLGLTVRFYLEQLRLLLVPRLAAVLIVVVLLLIGISVVSDELGIATGLSVGLFPIVILSMVIERMSIVWEERGAGTAVKEGIGTLVVAIAAYLVMSVDLIEETVFLYPELLLVLLALTLVLGRYSGYRVSELIRFQALARGGSS